MLEEAALCLSVSYNCKCARISIDVGIRHANGFSDDGATEDFGGIFFKLLEIFKAILHDCQTRASVPASQRVALPRISLPTFTRWVPLEMPSVCLSPRCHVHRLNQVIAADMPQASAVPYSHGFSKSCFVFLCSSKRSHYLLLLNLPSNWLQACWI